MQGDGHQITVEPGLIGGEINKILAAHKKKHNHPIQYKIGPGTVVLALWLLTVHVACLHARLRLLRKLPL